MVPIGRYICVCGIIRVDMVKSVLRRDVRRYATLLGLVGVVLGYETRCFSAGESARMFWCTRRMCIALQGTRHGGVPAGVHACLERGCMK